MRSQSPIFSFSLKLQTLVMNPSAPGWITKYGSLFKEDMKTYTSYDALYAEHLAHGFVYGIHLMPPHFIQPEHELGEDEIAKINLLNTLYFCFYFETGSSNFEEFVTTVFRYYQELDAGKISFLAKILAGNKTVSQLEKLIDSRIYPNGNVFRKALGSSLTNSLLYIDVLTFRSYLANNTNIKGKAQLLEYVTLSLAYQALNSKKIKEHDEKLIQLLKASLTYVDIDNTSFIGNYPDVLNQEFTSYEKAFLLDFSCIAVWEDKTLDRKESQFIFSLASHLGRSKTDAQNAVKNVALFFEENLEKISYLKDTNLASKFYEGMTKNVSKLILRNSKRLKKELSESKELMQLLAKSTTRELEKEERKKVQGQLLDIFKSIPSLAIFMLPGGAVLLPIFIKLIPKLLPSAFDDNRVEEKG